MASQPKAPFWLAVWAVILGLVGLAAWRAGMLDQFGLGRPAGGNAAARQAGPVGGGAAGAGAGDGPAAAGAELRAVAAVPRGFSSRLATPLRRPR